MDEPASQLRFESRLKQMIWHDIMKGVDARLELHLAQSRLLHAEMPDAETRDQLAAVESICREVKLQLADFDLRSAYDTELDILSKLPLLDRLLTAEQAAP